MKYLDKIKSPADVKNLNEDDLPLLAQEIREVLVDTVSQNGGHLASNLGVVELTIALHRVFDSPKDKIIWDVGHQAYTHKLLTGRYPEFETIRREGGLSGFTNPSESEHDIFYSGHSSTSISEALGVATANGQKRTTRDLFHDRISSIKNPGSHPALSFCVFLGNGLILPLCRPCCDHGRAKSA